MFADAEIFISTSRTRWPNFEFLIQIVSSHSAREIGSASTATMATFSPASNI